FSNRRSVLAACCRSTRSASLASSRRRRSRIRATPPDPRCTRQSKRARSDEAMPQSRSPTLSEVLRVALDARLADLHVSLPGRVERYNPNTKLADVKPLLQSTIIDEEDNEQLVSLPVIPNVPVVFQGAGGFRVTFP